MDTWRCNVAEPYKGLTNDGTLRKGLFRLEDEGAPVKAAVAATESLLEMLDDRQKKNISQKLDSDVWRRWQNSTHSRKSKKVHKSNVFTFCKAEFYAQVGSQRTFNRNYIE